MAEAKRLFDNGAASYAQGNYDAAIRFWEQSYEISQKSLIYESIANAYERLGDARKARDYLAKWRIYAPLEERDLLDARIKNLDARVAAADEATRKAAAEKAAADAAAAAAAEQAQEKPWLLGTIVAGAGGFLILTGVGLDIGANFTRPSSSLCKTTGGMTLCTTAAQGPINLSNHLALAGDILWATGAAAAAAGAVLIILRRPQPRDAGPPPAGAQPAQPAAAGQPAAWLAPAAGGLLLQGRF